MAKKVVQLYDKYKSTTKVFPKIIDECFEESAKQYIAGQVVANPTPTGEETTLATLKIGSTQYAIPVPTSVIANPELAGTEAELGSIQIGDTKYKIGGGGTQEYIHNIVIRTSRDGNKAVCGITIKSTSNTPFTAATLISHLANEGFVDYTKNYTNCNGFLHLSSSTNCYVVGLYSESNRLNIEGTNDGASINSQWFASTDIEIVQDFVK